MGKLVVVGVGAAAVVGAVLWMSSGSSDDSSYGDGTPTGSSYDSSTSSGDAYRRGTDTDQNDDAPQISPKDVADAGQRAGEAARDGYQDHVQRPRVQLPPRPPEGHIPLPHNVPLPR